MLKGRFVRGVFKRLDGQKKPLMVGEAFVITFGSKSIQFRPIAKEQIKCPKE
jgi:hypothetical protein